MAKYSLKVVYETDTAPTLEIEKSSLEEVVARAEEINSQHGNDAIGYYIQKIKD